MHLQQQKASSRTHLTEEGMQGRISRAMLGICRGNGKEHGNNYNVVGLCKDNGRENGDYHVYKGVVLRNRVRFWIPVIIWHLIFRAPKKGP